MSLILIYLVIGLVWTTHYTIKIGDFFDVDTFEAKLGRVGAFLLAVVAWPIMLLAPWIEGYVEGRNERKQSKK